MARRGQTGEENDLSRLKKMLLAAVASMAIVAVVAASPASATVPSEGKANAEQANVPYLAWRGEHVRLGYCNPLDQPEGTTPFTSADKVTWHIEDWSGDPANGSVPVPSEMLEGSTLRRQRLRVHGLRVAEGRRRVHQARHRLRHHQPDARRQDVPGRLDAAEHARPHGRRPGHGRRLQLRAGDRGCPPRTPAGGSVPGLRRSERSAPPRHGDGQGHHPAARQLQRVGPAATT